MCFSSVGKESTCNARDPSLILGLGRSLERDRLVVVQLPGHVRLLQPHGLQPARLLCPWDSPGKITGVGCHFLLQGIFPTQPSLQEQSPGLLHCRQILYQLSCQGTSKLWGRLPTLVFLGFSDGSAGKESACNTGDLGSILLFFLKKKLRCTLQAGKFTFYIQIYIFGLLIFYHCFSWFLWTNNGCFAEVFLHTF